tara:strand:- start:273 stop:1040 length:768 start_codon:yes stop_codon:yes gene_type:complete
MTAVVTKSDISGSQLSLAYKDYNKDAAIRRFFVEADASDNKTTVITAVYNAIGLTHNEQSSLPLQTLTATRVGIGKWLVIARYDRSVTTSLPLGSSLLVDAQTAFESVTIYTDNSNYTDGVPFGSVLASPDALFQRNERSGVERKSWQRPVIRLKWPFAQGTHPLINYNTAAGTLNANALNIAGNVGLLPAQSVRYDGLVLDTKATTLGPRYYGYHAMTYAPNSSWLHQTLFWNGAQWAVRLEQSYPVGSWVAPT